MINPLVSLCSRRLNGGAGSRIVCINRAGLISLWLLLLSLGASIQPAQASSPASGPVNYETITFLNTDGHSYTRYTTTRSDQTSYQVFFDKTANLDDYVYINPNEYEYSESDPKANVLSFAQGNYALIGVGDYVNYDHPERSLVTQDSDGTFTLTSWDGTKQSNGHYGFWNSPANFSSFAIAWVLPDDFELIEYHANRQGDWVQRGNTLTFFATNVNDLTFELRYKHVKLDTFSSLRESIDQFEHTQVEQDQNSLTVILDAEILFASGSVTLSDRGEEMIRKLADNIAQDPEIEVIVEGHTDDVTITGALADIYPTNWELSAKRALNVVHALSSAGIHPTRLQARAFGPFRPRVANDSAANRRINRRIEVVLRPTTATAQTP